MVWKDFRQLRKIYTDEKFVKNFSNLFALKKFFEESIVEADYKPPDEFENAVILTPIGTQLATKIQNSFKDICVAEINYALFLKFSHQSLLIDVENTNPEDIRNILNKEILVKKIRHPWIFETILYDRYFELFEDELLTLSYGQTQELLKDTPQGVFQIKDILIGPFGVLTSSCFRFLPPVLKSNLWHCSDITCTANHETTFSSGNVSGKRILDFLSKQLEEIEGLESQWFGFFLDSAGRENFYDDMHLFNLPPVLIDGFSEKEVRNILSRLIEHNSKEIRELFPSDKRFKNIFSGSGNHISMKLNKPQAVQLILLMPNEVIIECIESLIDDEIIKIPNTENRTSRFQFVAGGAFNPICSVSRLGLRSYPSEYDIAILRLKRLIKSLFIEKNELKDLEYKLRYINGKKLNEKLENYLFTKNPKDIVRDLITSNQRNLEKTFKLLRYGKFGIPSTIEKENHLIDKILWKLGFDISLFPPQNAFFWERLKNFLDISQKYPIDDESNREIIRSAGVNFFVSLEEILKLSLSFMTWALLSDHFIVTKFKFNFLEAQKFMASCLNGKSVGSNQPLILDEEGKNSLYPLIQGFTVLAELCEELVKNHESRLRPKHELPHFYGKTELQLFPFIHKELILDIPEYDCNRIIEFLRKITTELEKGQASKIRNQIDHQRDDFPNSKEIEDAVTSIKTIMSEAEHLGIIPLIYSYVGSKKDKYNREVFELENYNKKSVTIIQPSQYNSINIPSISKPLIIVPCMHIGDSIELIRFDYQESSEYIEMWKNYPRRRTSEEIKDTE